MGENLFWNDSAARSDSSNHYFDFLSNGFKVRELLATIETGIMQPMSMQHGQKHQHLTCMVDSPTQDNINK